MTRTALYRHYDAAGALLYVGITDSLSERDKQHAANSHWHGAVYRTETQWLQSRTAAMKAETRAILQESPKHNIQGVVGDGLDAIGRRIAFVRSFAGLNQADFAVLIGVKRSRLSLWECGAQRLSISGALAIHKALGTSLDWLYFGAAQ